MKKVRVFYRDQVDGREYEWDVGPYDPKKAHEVKENLSLMGCYDFRMEAA